MPYEIEYTRQFLRDMKLAHKRGLDTGKVLSIVALLAQGLALPPKNRDHALTGDYRGYR